MQRKFANIIIDISHEKVDRPFQYKVPENLKGQISVGMQVLIPFGKGNRQRTGYVLELTDKAEYDIDRLKEIAGIAVDRVSAESQLIQLAWWIKERYGSTMNQALKTVLPVKQVVKAQEKKSIRCLIGEQELAEAIETAHRKHYQARERLLRALQESPVIPYEVIRGQMNLAPATWKPLVEQGIIAYESQEVFRDPVGALNIELGKLQLNESQNTIVEDFCHSYDQGIRNTSLIYGITGSGKTEVYMEMISHVLEAGRQVIVLIPEIALTYQTVMRFYKRFGQRVSIINSKLSPGERYDQFERARQGDIDIMIGPRSALFTPFQNLGLIIIDEEHEGAYKSEGVPRYHARDVAVKRAEMNHASVVLGSATPSLEAYTKALRGTYKLYELKERAKKQSHLAHVQIADLREELKAGNKTIFSRILQEKLEERLAKGEQTMLFLNRRGYSNFVSCRSCGEAIKCPHCDVTLTLHRDGRLVCHYCGHTIPMPKACPSCGSKYIANFGVGTQKIEAMVQKMYPQARVLRMDLDTTSKKGGHEEILSAFAQGDADILIGTQMIVKGHDFPNVTLVGVIAADISLYSPDYRCGERTFQLLTQAAGRAGRDQIPGDVIIQTYKPDHYSITCAADQDYESFYRQEMAYRKLLHYPPVTQLLTIQFASKDEDYLTRCVDYAFRQIQGMEEATEVQLIGPAEASIYKIHDIYRKILYIKNENYDILIQIQNKLEQIMQGTDWCSAIQIQYDFT